MPKLKTKKGKTKHYPYTKKGYKSYRKALMKEKNGKKNKSN